LENGDTKAIDELITLLDKPPSSNFKFIDSLKSFTSIAKELKRKGIEAPSQLTFEEILRILRYVVIPIAVGLLTLLPEIIRMLTPSV